MTPAAGEPGAVAVERYTPDRANEWNEFVARSKNGTFLFDRRYMDYHADRFADHSLLFRAGGKLVAVLPASERDGALASHGGLTYGGVVTDRRMRVATVLDVFAALRAHLRERGLSGLLYKAVPHIYHQVPADEDLYALFVNGAKLVRRDVAATVDLRDRVGYAKGRKSSAAKAKAGGLEVRESRDFRGFMGIEAAHLLAKFGTRPVHTADEMELLAGRFPDNVRLFAGFVGGRMVGGVVVYQSARVAHAQYIGATDEGRAAGCLDLVTGHLLDTVYPGVVPYFDFGISTERGGAVLNRGLAANKEGYGGRAVVYDAYDLPAGG